jgi:uncharacterized protein (TIGR03545 family)/uncharacterized protein (TIGR03546 family)
MLDFLTSFFKELNSASNKKMISLAIVLGLISGFLPTFTFLNYIILFFVFIFRIPLGLYFASFAVFKLFSYLFDPLFNKIGYAILTFKPLEGFFTFLYNLPILRWSGFNNTLVMGSLVAGIVVGVVVFIVLNRFIDTYRQKVFPKLKKIKFFSWIVPKEEKRGIFRLSGLIGIAVLTGAFSLAVVLFLDPLVKFILQTTLSKTLHKKVYIQKVNVKLFEPSLDIEGMQIDRFLIKKAYLKLSSYYLLWRKFDIEKLIVDAKTNQPLLKIVNTSSSKGKKFKLPSIKLPSAEEVLQKKTLKSEMALKKLQKDYKEFEEFYKSVNINSYKQQVLAIKKEIDSLKHTKIKSLKDIEELKSKAKKIQNEIKNLKLSANENIKKLNFYKNLLSEDIKNLKTALNEDKKDILAQFNMIKKGEFVKFSEIYLKPQISKYINLVLDAYKKIKPYLPQKQKKEIVIPRKGVYVKFEDKIHYPDFVLELSKITLKTSVALYHITLKNIADNQLLLNRYALILLNANSRFYNINAQAKYLRKFEFKGHIGNIKLKEIAFDKLKILHPLINADFKGEYDKKLNSFGEILFKNVRIVFEQNDKISKLINEALKGIREFKVYVKVYGSLQKPDIKVSSDLDKIISKEISKVYKAQLQKEKQKAINLLNKRVQKELQKYNLNVDAKINSLKDVNSYLEKLKKELIKTVVDKEKNKVKQKVLNKLKSFF